MRIPSKGAIAIDSNAIVIGTFIDKGTNAVLKVEECILGGIETGAELNITSFGIPPFFSPSEITEILHKKKLLVMGKKDSTGLVLPYGLRSVLPNDDSDHKWPNDIERCKSVVENILKYQRISANDNNELLTSMMSDLDNSLGRLAVMGFMCEDVRIWESKKELRREIGCIIGFQLLKFGIFDDASVAFFRSGMSSLPLSLKLSYLYSASIKGNECRIYCKEALLSLLKTMGYKDDDITKDKINTYIKRSAVIDMKNSLHTLRSNDEAKRKYARIVLGMVSSRPSPKDMNYDDEVLYWVKIIKELETQR